MSNLGHLTAEGLASRPLTFRCLTCKNLIFSPTGKGMPCSRCGWSRMEVVEK